MGRGTRRHWICLLALTLLLAWATGLEARGGFRPHSHPERNWHHEQEFQDDPTLHATPEHVVILHLESSPTGELVVQRIPYFFEHPSPFTFCIKDEDPHVVEMALVAVANGEIVVRVTRGGECVTVTIEPGRYELFVTHDGTDIDDDGKKAFVHVPRRRDAAVASGDKAGVAPDQAAGDYPSGLCAGWSALRTLDGSWLVLGGPTNDDSQLDPTQSLMVRTAAPAPVPDFQWALPFWQICPGSLSLAAQGRTNLNPRPQHTAASAALSGDSLVVQDISAQPIMAFTDLGSFELTMSTILRDVCGTNSIGLPILCSHAYPVVVDTAAPHRLRKATSTTATPTTFKVVMTQYPSGNIPPPLVAGQVEIRYSDTTYVNVFNTSVADLAADPLDFLVTSSNISRIRLGPQTVVTFFARPNYTGSRVTIGTDGPSPSEPSLGISFDPQSLRIQTARDFVVATHQCKHCNLNDVDFSGLTFQGTTSAYLDFTESTFHRANLSQASFSYVVFDRADFSNATFDGTRLDHPLVFCTSFANTDLSTTTVVAPLYQTDFSCRLRLTDAVLAPHTFPPASWRFSNLTGATFTNVAGVVLSSREAPLDLRGAFLNGVSLRGAVLDYADLGCVNVHLPDTPVTTVTQLCTDLKTFTTADGTIRRADLTGASLKHASLVGAQLQGVSLDNANLTSANLCNAQLNQFVGGLGSATLIGAELKDTNLFGVEATGATFNYANFYSSGGSSNCAVTDCSTGGAACATISHGTFNSAKFVGAYLPGLDMTGVTSAQGVTFTDAFLVGATLSGNLTTDPATGAKVTFDGAFLQGADFSAATVDGAIFKDALFTIPGGDANGGNIIVKLDPRNVSFPGYTPSSPGSLGCVLYIYNEPAKLPVGRDFTCPDGSHGVCSPASWNALPAATATAWTSDFSNPAGCADIDFNWILQE